MTLERHTPLTRRGELKRSGRLNPVSPKRRKRQPERDACRKVVLERADGRCEARLDGCTTWATDVHELLSRARGGDIYDPAGCRALCRTCHHHITTEPAWAEANGWSRHSWERDA